MKKQDGSQESFRTRVLPAQCRWLCRCATMARQWKLSINNRTYFSNAESYFPPCQHRIEYRLLRIVDFARQDHFCQYFTIVRQTRLTLALPEARKTRNQNFKNRANHWRPPIFWSIMQYLMKTDAKYLDLHFPSGIFVSYMFTYLGYLSVSVHSHLIFFLNSQKCCGIS